MIQNNSFAHGLLYSLSPDFAAKLKADGALVVSTDVRTGSRIATIWQSCVSLVRKASQQTN